MKALLRDVTFGGRDSDPRGRLRDKLREIRQSEFRTPAAPAEGDSHAIWKMPGKFWAARAGFVLPFVLASWATAQSYTITDLGTLGKSPSIGEGISAAGQVVGESFTNQGVNVYHAFIYADGTMQDLNSFIDPSLGWDLAEAAGINDGGQITGWGDLNGEPHAFLLTPTPEPGACAIGLIAALGLLRRRRRGSNNEPLQA